MIELPLDYFEENEEYGVWWLMDEEDGEEDNSYE